MIASVLLLASGCLYTKSQVQSRFRVQLLDKPGAVITVVNRSELALEVCDHGGTDSYCEHPMPLAPGGAIELRYRTRILLSPTPEEVCFGTELCVIADLQSQPENTWSASSDYVLADNQQGLALSVRRARAEQGTKLVAASDVRMGDGCFALVIIGGDADFDPTSEPVVVEQGRELAVATWKDVDCSGPP